MSEGLHGYQDIIPLVLVFLILRLAVRTGIARILLVVEVTEICLLCEMSSVSSKECKSVGITEKNNSSFNIENLNIIVIISSKDLCMQFIFFLLYFHACVAWLSVTGELQ